MNEKLMEEIHEFVSDQLSWLADFLMTKYGLTAKEAKQIIGKTLIWAV